MKKCSRCKKEKPFERFYSRSRSVDGLQPWCKDCSNENRVIHYHANPARTREYEKERVDALRRIVVGYLADHPCIDCGEKDIIVLEFDHVRGQKLAHISTMVFSQVSVEKLMAEIEKCEVRCANCHRRVTVARRKQIVISG